jgi:hypothetical protein
MKKLYVFGMAIALMAPMAVLTTGSAGAAAAGTTCGKPVGTIKIAPGLGSTPKVQTISISLPIKACKGGGVTGGTSKGSIKTAAITAATFANGKPVKLNDTITWAGGKGTTTFTASSTTTVKGGVITAVISGKVSKGLFKGLTASTTVTVKLGKPGADKLIKSLSISATKPFTIK